MTKKTLPQSPPTITSEQQNLQTLGIFFNKLAQEYDIAERVMVSMKTRLLDFGVALQKLQQEVQNKKEVEQKYIESHESKEKPKP